MAKSNVKKLYNSVIEDVINGVKESFIDEGLDEQVLVELKTLWEKKLEESKVLDHEPKILPARTGTRPLSTRQPHAEVPQITVPAGSVISPAMFQYTTQGQGDQRSNTVLLSLPQKLNFTVPAQLAQAGLQALTSSSGSNIQIQQFPSQQFPNVQCTQLTAEQLQNFKVVQFDGANDDTSDEDVSSLDESDILDDEDDDREEPVENDPLNSEDDISDEDCAELFQTENLVVCQFEKVSRHKNKWKFLLKDGIMNLKAKDYIFQKAMGDAEW